MQEKIDYLTKKLFGTSSEKSKNIEGQLSLFNEAEQEAASSEIPVENTETLVKAHTRKAKGTHAELFQGVPSRDEVIPLSGNQKYCTECGTEMKVIGKEFVRQEFRFTPAKGEVVNIYRETAKCPVCSELPAMAGAVRFVKANVPEALIPHSYASASGHWITAIRLPRECSTATGCSSMNGCLPKKVKATNSGKNTGCRKKSLCWTLSGIGSQDSAPKEEHVLRRR